MLNYEFKNKNLYQTAITHKSYFYENKITLGFKENAKFELDQLAILENDVLIISHNEKLEFLGDAVLDLIVTDLLMQKFPQDNEGSLSKKRASLVNESTLAMFSQKIGLPEKMLFGKGEQQTGGDKKPRLQASAFEALIGAIYLDGGFQQAKSLIEVVIIDEIEKMALGSFEDFHNDYKTRLQEIIQSEGKSSPLYKIISETGPSHEKIFEVEISMTNYPPVRATGKSKKNAEQAAAKIALKIWEKQEL